MQTKIIWANWAVFHLNDTLYRYDVSCMSQAYRLIWSQALISLLHHLQQTHKTVPPLLLWNACSIENFHIWYNLKNTSLKSVCSIKMVFEKGTTWLPLASLDGKSGTRSSFWIWEKNRSDPQQLWEYACTSIYMHVIQLYDHMALWNTRLFV